MTSSGLPVILAERGGIVFVAVAAGTTVPRSDPSGARVVPVCASGEELRSAESVQLDPGSWPLAAPRPDLLGSAVSRLLDNRSGPHAELDIHPGTEGLKVRLIKANGDADPIPVPARDAMGFLAAVLSHAPRGIASTGKERPRHVLLEIEPSARRNGFTLRCLAVAEKRPSSLSRAGLTPSQVEQLESIREMTSLLLLVSGGPGSGRSTTLGLVASLLSGDGRRGGIIGEPNSLARSEGLSWLAPSVRGWPFAEAARAMAPDFVVIDNLDAEADLPYAAQLASQGLLVLAGIRNVDPEVLARGVGTRLESAFAPAVPVAVLGQSLVRTICPDCTASANVPPDMARRMGFHPDDLETLRRKGGLTAPRGQGCGSCSGTGASGVTGVFEFLAAGETGCTPPRRREEAWRRVLQGTVSIDDAAGLPMTGTTMQPLFGVRAGSQAQKAASAAGSSDQPIDQSVEEDLINHTGPELIAGLLDSDPDPEAGEESAQETGTPLDDAGRLAGLLAAARTSGAGQDELEEIVRRIVTRSTGPLPIGMLVAPSRGFHLARHSVNTAAIAVRIATEWDSGFDLVGVARLGLLHDVGLVQAGVDPSADLPATVSKGSLDQTGTRWKPGPMLKAFGLESSELPDLIRQVHKLFTPRGPAGEEGPPTDPGSQVVALASLVECESHTTVAGRSSDLHDATTIIMERYRQSFHHALFRALLRAIPIFPLESIVELSSGDLARVVGLNDENHFRPRVEIVTVSGAHGLPKRVVDLARAPFLHIRHRIQEADSGAIR